MAMPWNQLTLPVRDLDEVTEYYRGTLGLPVRASGSALEVELGGTVLRFEQRAYPGSIHLAFTIPTGSFAAARRWLEPRSRLLGRCGVDQFEGPGSWNSLSMYFIGPDEQVLELIERRDLVHGWVSGREFAAADLVGVSELGVAVPDVVAAVAQAERHGVRPYGGEPEPSFAAVGTIDALIILVSPGRVWFPTTDRLAQPAPTAGVIVGPHGVGPLELGESVVELREGSSAQPQVAG